MIRSRTVDSGRLRDWSDDTYAPLQSLGIERPPHLAGWSTGGAAVERWSQVFFAFREVAE